MVTLSTDDVFKSVVAGFAMRYYACASFIFLVAYECADAVECEWHIFPLSVRASLVSMY